MCIKFPSQIDQSIYLKGKPTVNNQAIITDDKTKIIDNVKTETTIKDKVSMIKLKPGDFNPNDGCSFKVGKTRSNVEGGEGLASANADSIADKFYPKVDPSIKPEGMSDKVNLDSKADRIKFANSSTQMATKSGDAFTNGCGPACIVNGAMMDGGKEGLLNLVKVIKERGSDSYEQEGVATKRWKEIPGWDNLDDIKTRIRDNTATRQDMISLQEIVYHQLRHMESPKRNGGDGTASINVDKLREYINTDTSTLGIVKDRPLQKTFKDMNVKLIDTDGDKKNSEHFVLSFNKDINGKPEENSLYDPWPKTNGNQIVNNPNEIKAYHDSVMNSYR